MTPRPWGFAVLWSVCSAAPISAPTTCTSTTQDLVQALSPCTPASPGFSAEAEWELSILDATGMRQTIDGFGAAWTDATVEVFNSLSTDSQRSLLNELYGDGGIRMRLSRHTAGQSDLSPAGIGPWSYDESSGDVGLTDFALTDPGEKMVGWLRRMREAAAPSEVKLLGSVWSPPRWMKNSSNTLLREYHDVYKNYLVKYLQAFRDANVTVDAITLQNEPLHSADNSWTMFMDSSEAAILSNLTKHALKTAGLDTEIWAYDHNTDVPEYPQTVLDSTPLGTISAVAWHCYAPDNDWKVLSAFEASNPGVPQYMTECWLHLDSGESFFDLPNFTVGPLQNYAKGVLAWILGGSVDYDVGYPGGCSQCSGIIQVDKVSGTYTKTQDFYTLGQFSAFVDVGAQVLETTGNWDYDDGTGVQSSAFRNINGDLVLVVVNKVLTPLLINLALESGIGWNAQVEGSSVSTFVLPMA